MAAWHSSSDSSTSVERQLVQKSIPPPTRPRKPPAQARAPHAGGSYDCDFAFDIVGCPRDYFARRLSRNPAYQVGYSMPLTMALQTAACVAERDDALRYAATFAPLVCLLCHCLGAMAVGAAEAQVDDGAGKEA